MIEQTGRVLVLLLALTAQLCSATITATVDRTVITDMEMITLTVRASDESSGADLDFSGIERDFTIVNTSNRTSSSMSIVNGRTTSVVYKDHVLTLMPLRLGTLSIPPISAGNERSAPIAIRVQQQSPSQRQRMNQYVFFETEVDTYETYVQGQIIYSVRLFYTEAIGGDFPPAPALPDTVVEILQSENRYESIVDGQRYYVLEKRYALFPQRSGRLVIPQERFIGSRGRGGVFAQRERVNAVSESHTIEVKTIPAEFIGDVWIPAKALGIRESWANEPPQFRVGEPVNRRLAISAIGLPESLLPQFGEMTIENAKVYADPPTTENRVSAGGITALQVTNIGIVPTQAGEITLPEVSIAWWNTQTDQPEVAVIPAATYTVLPSASQPSVAPTPEAFVGTSSAGIITDDGAPAIWQWATIVFASLWIISSWQWMLARRRISALEIAAVGPVLGYVSDDPDESREFKILKQACTRNQAARTHHQLLIWGKARYPDLSSVSELGRRFPGLAPDISELETHLYGSQEPASWRGAALLEGINKVRRNKRSLGKPAALADSLNPA